MIYLIALIISVVTFTLLDHWKEIVSWKKTGEYTFKDESGWSSYTKVGYGFPTKRILSTATFTFFLTALLIGVVIFFIGISVGDNPKYNEYKLDYQYSIYGMDDSITNTFVVRRLHQTESSSHIRFYHVYKTSSGGKKIGWINQDNSEIFDVLDKDQQSYIEVYKGINTYEEQGKWIKLFAFKFMFDNDNDKFYKIYVPKGTVSDDFSIDLN